MNSKDKQQKKPRLIDFDYFVYDLCRITGVLPSLIALRPKTYFINKKAKKRLRGAALLMGNHVGYIDPVRLHLAFWYRRINCVATEELFAPGAKKWFFTKAHCIPVNTQSPGVKFFNEVTERLKEGKVVGVFPEGHINRTGNTFAGFKSGIVLMAIKGNAPIIPIYFKPFEHWYNRLRIVVGEPIDIRSMCAGERMSIEELEAAAQYLQDKVLELKEYLDTKQYKHKNRKKKEKENV